MNSFTTNYNLDLYDVDDKPNLNDQYNDAMGKIDNAMHDMAGDIVTAETAVQNLSVKVDGFGEDITNLQTAVTTAQTTAENGVAAAHEANELAVQASSAAQTAQTTANKAAKFYADTTSLKADSGTVNGTIVETMGFYAEGDGGNTSYRIGAAISPDGVTEISITGTSLSAFIIPHTKMRAREFGASDSMDDNSDIINKAIKFIMDKALDYSLIIDGTFNVTDTIKINDETAPYTKFNLIGIDRTVSGFTNTGAVSGNSGVPILTAYGSIGLYDLYFGDKVGVPMIVQVLNDSRRYMIRCYVETISGLLSIDPKVDFTTTTGFTGSSFLAKIEECVFSRVMVMINSTDSFIHHNIFWGNDRTIALQCNQVSNGEISYNQFIPGYQYGAINFTGGTTNTQTGVRLIGNYFDGSYSQIPNSVAIQGNAAITSCIFADNMFWNLKNTVMSTNLFNCSTFANNQIFECANTNGKNIINIGNANGSTFSGNTFKAPSGASNLVPINIVAATNPNIIIGNGGYSSGFTKSTVPADTVIEGNNPTMF